MRNTRKAQRHDQVQHSMCWQDAEIGRAACISPASLNHTPRVLASIKHQAVVARSGTVLWAWRCVTGTVLCLVWVLERAQPVALAVAVAVTEGCSPPAARLGTAATACMPQTQTMRKRLLLCPLTHPSSCITIPLHNSRADAAVLAEQVFGDPGVEGVHCQVLTTTQQPEVCLIHCR